MRSAANSGLSRCPPSDLKRPTAGACHTRAVPPAEGSQGHQEGVAQRAGTLFEASQQDENGDGQHDAGHETIGPGLEGWGWKSPGQRDPPVAEVDWARQGQALTDGWSLDHADE